MTRGVLRGVVRVVTRARHVERDAKERRLDDLVLFDSARQLLLAEAGQARPQSDVGGLRPLGLNRAERLDGLLDAQLAPLEQQLAREECAVELPQRKDVFRHSSRPKNDAEIA